jgi:hypothetical protein
LPAPAAKPPKEASHLDLHQEAREFVAEQRAKGLILNGPSERSALVVSAEFKKLTWEQRVFVCMVYCFAEFGDHPPEVLPVRQPGKGDIARYRPGVTPQLSKFEMLGAPTD